MPLLKAVFDRVDKRATGSKKSGASVDDVYKSSWKHFRAMQFARICSQVAPSVSTMLLSTNTGTE